MAKEALTTQRLKYWLNYLSIKLTGQPMFPLEIELLTKTEGEMCDKSTQTDMEDGGETEACPSM